MSEKSSSSSSGGIGFVGLLTIVFITLKLLGKVDWSWWWVLSPIWIAAILSVGLLVLFVGGAFLFAGLDTVLDRRRFHKARESRHFGARRTTGRVIEVETRKDKSTFVN